MERRVGGRDRESTRLRAVICGDKVGSCSRMGEHEIQIESRKSGMPRREEKELAGWGRAGAVRKV